MNHSQRVLSVIFCALIFSPFIADALVPCPFAWDRSLRMGMRGDDVKALQSFLSVSPSGYFGPLTMHAVREYQTREGLDSVGAVGPLTRVKLNSACAAPVPVPDPIVSAEVPHSSLLIAPADQPLSSLAPAGALYVPFTRFTLTAGGSDVAIQDVVVQRVGPSRDGAFSYLSLLDEDDSELSYGYLRSDHRVTFRDVWTVPAGTTKTLTVAGNMNSDLSDYDGQAAILQVVSLNSGDAVQAGAFPISGALQTMNSTLVIGSATAALSSYDPGVATSRTIFDTGVRFSGIRISADSHEDLRLDGITWEQSGTAGPADIANVTVYVDGVAYPTENDGKSYTATFEGGLTIAKGFSKDIYVTADILPGAANRTIKFDVRGSTDVWIVGKTYGYGIAPYATGNTATEGESVFLTSDGTEDGDEMTPFFSGPTATISSVSFNISR